MTANEIRDRVIKTLSGIVPELDAGTVARHNALVSLDNIRRVMALRDHCP